VPRVTFVLPDGSRSDEVGRDGQSVMRVAISSSVDGIVGECGGELSCATCHVFVDPGWIDTLSPASEDELDMLDATSEVPTEFSRLSCQIICSDRTDGIIIQIPETQH